MGISKSTHISILVLGASKTGKTDFIDRISYGETSNRPTNGIYNTNYTCGWRWARKTIRFTEIGGTLNSCSWHTLARFHKDSCDCIYFFIKRDASRIEILNEKNRLLFVCGMLDSNIPVCVIHRWDKRKKKKKHLLSFEEINNLLQLEYLGNQRMVWAIQIATFGSKTADSCERLLDWTIRNAR